MGAFKHGSPSQEYAAQMWHRHDIFVYTGPPGSGKTYTAIGLALSGPGKIIVTRPKVGTEHNEGALPGRLDAKMAPYTAPFVDCQGQKVLSKIEFVPFNFMRGRTFDGVTILDEGQNCTVSQMRTFIGRLGAGSKLIVTGDMMQCDLPGHVESGLSRLLDRAGHKVCHIEFVGTFRHQLAGEILDLMGN